jgi:hypothetical protein
LVRARKMTLTKQIAKRHPVPSGETHLQGRLQVRKASGVD